MKKYLFLFLIFSQNLMTHGQKGLEFRVGYFLGSEIGFHDYKFFNEPNGGHSVQGLQLSVTTETKKGNHIRVGFSKSFKDRQGIMVEHSQGSAFPELRSTTRPYSTPGNGWSVSVFEPDYLYDQANSYLSYSALTATFGKSVESLNPHMRLEFGAGVTIALLDYETYEIRSRPEFLWVTSDQDKDYYDYWRSEEFESNKLYQERILKPYVPVYLAIPIFADRFLFETRIEYALGENSFGQFSFSMGYVFGKEKATL
jgi:hypothetical protein